MRWFRHRLPWILGILLLTGSLLGANWIIHKGNADHDKKNGGADTSNSDNKQVVAIGEVTTESGQSPLIPGTVGEVTDIYVKDGQHVTKDTPLLRLDSRFAQLQVTHAQSGVKLAEIRLTQAEAGIKKWQSLVEAKKEAIEAKKLEKQSAQEKLETAKRLSDSNSPTVKAGALDIRALDRAISAFEKELEALEVSKPTPELDMAKENLTDAKTQLEQAQLGVEKCVLKAPSDGTVVRISTRVGDKFGPNVNFPAFSFRPDGDMLVRAEVDQEWAAKVQMGQKAVIYDWTNSGRVWRGKVTFVSDTFMPRRDNANPNLPANPFQPQQENVLEFRVTLDPGQTPKPLIGQKVRVYLGAN